MSLQNPSLPESISGWQSDKFAKNNLDFCRFWLAILVIYSHSYALADGNEDAEPLGILTRGQLNSGPFAVCCFFIISGFLITHSWMRSKSYFDFLLKRVCRIYPGYIVVVLLGFFVLAPFVSEGYRLGIKDLAILPMSLVSLRNREMFNAFPNNPIPGALNGSLWSIPYEFKCYLAVMVIGLVGLLTNRRSMIPLLLFVTVLVGALYPYVAIPILDQGGFASVIGGASVWARVFPYFFAGLAFYIYRKAIPFSYSLFGVSAVAFAVASVMPPCGRFIFPLAITYLLFWFAFHPSIHFEDWSRYGDFSYGIYLYAFPIQQLIAMLIPGVSAMTLFLIATPLSVIAGALSWHLVEKHFLRIKHRLPTNTMAPLQPGSIEGSVIEGGDKSSFNAGAIVK